MKKAAYQTVANGLTDTSQANRAKDIYYHCEICQDYIPSQPRESVKCNCSNIIIDVDYVRLMVKDFSKFTVVRNNVE